MRRSALFLLTLLTACAVGPDYAPPPAPEVHNYIKTPMTEAMNAGGDEKAQSFRLGQTVTVEWWNLFHAQPLDSLVKEGIAKSPTLEAAQATLAAAQEAVRQAEAGFYPQIDANAGVQRGQANNGPVNNIYAVGGTAGYAPDVFGGTRRSVERAEAQEDYQRYQLGAAYLSLTGNIATQAITLASLRAQLEALESITAEDKRILDMINAEFEAGKVAKTDVLTAESQLASDQTQLAPLRQQVNVAEHALAVLTGNFSGAWSPPELKLADLTLPADLPVTLPSELVHQRPDILSSEAQLRTASAAIGIAEAQMYPSFNLSAAATTQALATGALFGASSLIWNIAAGMTAPIFHGGALQAQTDEAVDLFKAAAATYRQTVLQAFGQVADTLRALQHDAELLAAQKKALEVATTSAELQKLSYQAGKTDILRLIDAERAVQQAKLGYIRAGAQRYLDTVQLFIAMGGGWRVADSGK